MRLTLLQLPPCLSTSRCCSLMLSFLPQLIVREFLKNLLLFSGSSCHVFYVRAQPSLSLSLDPPALFVMASHGFYSIWGENLFPVRRFICVIKLLATCNNANNASNIDNNNNEGNSGNYHNFWLVKVCNNFSRFPPPETKKWRKMRFNISHEAKNCSRKMLPEEGGKEPFRRSRGLGGGRGRRLRLFRDLFRVCVLLWDMKNSVCSSSSCCRVKFARLVVVAVVVVCVSAVVVNVVMAAAIAALLRLFN